AYSPPITIAGGRILDPHPPRAAIRTAAALERCRRLDADAATDAGEAELQAAAVMIEGAGIGGLPVAGLVSRGGVEPKTVDSRIAALIAHGAAARVADTLVAPHVLRALRARVTELLRAHHAAEPLSDGVPREEARERLFAHGHPAVFERALEELAAAPTIVGRDRLALSTH